MSEERIDSAIARVLHEPALVPDRELVDPLSLALSLQDNTDQRVQLALDELKEHFPW